MHQTSWSPHARTRTHTHLPCLDRLDEGVAVAGIDLADVAHAEAVRVPGLGLARVEHEALVGEVGVKLLEVEVRRRVSESRDDGALQRQ